MPARWLPRALFGAALLVGCGRAAPKSSGDASASDSAGATAGVTGAAGTMDGGEADGVAGADGVDGTGGDKTAGTAGAGGTTVLHESAGCNHRAPAGDVPGTFATHIVDVNGVDPIYQGGSALAQQSGTFTFVHRPYAVRLPSSYDETQSHTVVFAGGGCGTAAQNFAVAPNAGYVIDPKHTNIEVGLNPVGPCFADGGPSISDRDDTPDVPYFRAVLADVEAQFCIDTSKVFVAGFSSGAWEAQTLGCAAADVIKGVATVGGGMRAHRPRCTGPVPALLVVNTTTADTPLGPLAPTDPTFVRTDSPGALPTRDELLARNGCVGLETEPFGAPFPVCMKFTGCPATAPVVWCRIASSGINVYMNYSPGPILQFLSSLP